MQCHTGCGIIMGCVKNLITVSAALLPGNTIMKSQNRSLVPRFQRYFYDLRFSFKKGKYNTFEFYINQFNFLLTCFLVRLTDFRLSDQEAPFWRKIKFFGIPGKAHEVAMGGGSIGTVLVHSALTVMSLFEEEETDWENFLCFGDMSGR